MTVKEFIEGLRDYAEDLEVNVSCSQIDDSFPFPIELDHLILPEQPEIGDPPHMLIIDLDAEETP